MNTRENTSNSFIRCGYCHGLVPSDEGECLRCGAPINIFSPEPTLLELPLDEFITASNEKLEKTGTSSAELAFGVGCTLGVLIAGLLMVIIFFAITKTWTVLAVILFILTLISFLVSTFLATKAREATTQKMFEREVKPEIDQYISQKGISRDNFYHQASEILPASSQLLTCSAAERA